MTATSHLRRVGHCFDHLNAADMETEELNLAGVALEMVTSLWWKSVPVYVEPPPVSGEIPWK